MNDDLGDRIVRYQEASNGLLTKRVPVIIRVDGKSFHTVTRNLWGRRWHAEFNSIMASVAQYVQRQIQGCDFSYGQSDEISFLLTDYATIHTQPWFGYEINKLVSISAAYATMEFNRLCGIADRETRAVFDSRAFNVPQDDVCNYFIWRQKDAQRNAVQMAGREYFMNNEIQNKSVTDILDMLHEREGIDFENFSTVRKRGYCVVYNNIDYDIPVFTLDREYVEKFVDVRLD